MQTLTGIFYGLSLVLIVTTYVVYPWTRPWTNILLVIGFSWLSYRLFRPESEQETIERHVARQNKQWSGDLEAHSLHRAERESVHHRESLLNDAQASLAASAEERRAKQGVVAFPDKKT